MTAATAAVSLAKAGFRVFPLRLEDDPPGNAKRPAVNDFQGYASRGETEYRWSHRWKHHNPAIATGCGPGQEWGVLVGDFDVKNGKGGLLSLDILEEIGLPTRHQVQTGTGGRHVYMKVRTGSGITIAAEKLPTLPGFDWRCEGGYVVGPGTVLPDGRRYEWIGEPPARVDDLDEAPEWLMTMLRSASVKSKGTLGGEGDDQAPRQLDHPSAIARAVYYLVNDAPDAVEGAGGDQITFEIACRLRDFGLSRSAAFDVLAEHWNETGKASPPWSAEDLMQKVDNAFAYASGVWGGASGLNEFGDTTEDAPPARPRLYRLSFREAAESATIDAAEPLVLGLLDQQTMAVVYGASNTGKTFVTLDIAFHIATGRPWQGRETAQGGVVYVAAEGGRGILKRIAALRKHYGVEDAPLDIVPCPVNLLNSQADITGLIGLIQEAEAEREAPTRMVVIDTLSRALAGGDENASTDMGAFIKNVDRIRERVKATFCIVHHSGKDAARGARGWSGLRAAIDTEIEIAGGQITVEKQRDLEPIKPLAFKLKRVDVGQDPRGRRVESCVIDVLTGGEFLKIELNGRCAAFFDAFKDAAQDKALQAGRLERWRETPVDWSEWVEAYRASKSATANAGEHAQETPTGSAQKDFARRGLDPTNLRKMRATVIESGHVVKNEQDQYVMA